MNEQLTTALTDNYPTHDAGLRLLGEGAKYVYQIHRKEDADWILRAFPTNPDGYLPRGAGELARMLIYLEEYSYQTEQVIRTRSGQSTAMISDWELLVTTHVGQSLHAWVGKSGSVATADQRELTPAIWRKLGASLAQLHKVPIGSADDLPKAGMLPARELTWVGGYVAEVATEVSPQWRPWYDELRGAIDASHHCEDLDRVLIHCDPNLGNAAMDEQGDVVFIDWDVVGLGPAVLDLGSLMSNCVNKDLEPDEAAIHAVMDGYEEVRPLSKIELERLANTVPSQMLVTLGGYLPAMIRGEIGIDELIYGLTYAQWQTKYRAAKEIIAIAQAHGTRC